MKAPAILAALLIAASAAPSVHAQAAAAPDVSAPTTTPTASPMSDGEVRKIDKEQGKLTLRHGPIQNLDMPGMTMVFKVADPKMLDTVKEGDKVRFSADRIDGALTVTAIERV
jgi:Cu/Ag efflux protein CusF